MSQASLFPGDFPELGSYKILLDKRWKLDELNEYTKAYEQAYYAVFALTSLNDKPIIPIENRTRIHREMTSYPWRGGYSTLNFYFGVKHVIGKRRQPSVLSIKYASPGWIELSLFQEIAVNISLIVATLCGSVATINKTYNAIYRGLRERQLNEIAVEKERLNLDKDRMEFLRQSVREMGDALRLDETDKLVSVAGNELRALKILLSMYRRIRVLADYQEKGKAVLPPPEDRRA